MSPGAYTLQKKGTSSCWAFVGRRLDRQGPEEAKPDDPCCLLSCGAEKQPQATMAALFCASCFCDHPL